MFCLQVYNFAFGLWLKALFNTLCSGSIQTVGLGGLKHNTVMLPYPEHWKDGTGVVEERRLQVFLGKTSANRKLNGAQIMGLL